jgi:hypothetical protein
MRFACRSKQVQTRQRKAVDPRDALIMSLQREVLHLRKQLDGTVARTVYAPPSPLMTDVDADGTANPGKGGLASSPSVRAPLSPVAVSPKALEAPASGCCVVM